MGRRRDVPLLVVLAVAMLGFGLAAGLPPASARRHSATKSSFSVAAVKAFRQASAVSS